MIILSELFIHQRNGKKEEKATKKYISDAL
jgi:hypothetical protein